ncbi:MAG TPA: hypothetical protein V6C81_21500 [Planktothrix sp.]|jgi:hypothetical protein
MKRVLFTLSLCFGLLGATPALAQQTWLPNYDRNAVLQVSPQMQNQPGINFDAGFEDRVRQHAPNYEVHFVVTQQGSDLASADRTGWSSVASHQLFDAWVNQGMNETNAVLCVYIRANDSISGSIGCRVGSTLHSQGVSQSVMAQSNGPIASVGNSGQFRTDAQGASILVVDNLVNIASGGVSYSQPTSSYNGGGYSGSSSSSGSFVGSFWFWVIVIVAILFIVLLIAAASNGGSGGGGFFFFGGGGGGCSGGGGGGSCSSCGSSSGGGGSCSSCGSSSGA